MSDIEEAMVDKAIAEFPQTFGLRAFPGQKFHINRSASFVSMGKVKLYVFNDKGLAFAKDTPAALRRELVDAH